VASALARRSGRSLLLLHVLAPTPLFGRGRIRTAELVRFALGQRRAAETVLAEQASVLRGPGLRVAWLVRSGSAHQEIVAAASKVRASLIVIGIGPRRLSHVFLGSTAERVIARALCPVLTVPARAPTAAPSSRHRRRRTRAAAA